MTNNKVRNSAIDSTQAIPYQILIALDLAYSLEPEQKLWVEKFGDVTISQDSQTEVKKLKAPLSDNDIAFWNTIKNWLDSSFNHQHYHSLILYTTQSIGSKSIFNKWESSDLNKRYSDLQKIWNESEKKFSRSKNKDPTLQPSKVLDIQREIFDKKDTELRKIIPKIVIACNAPNYEKKWAEMVRKYARGIPSENQECFIRELMGYFISPNGGWEIVGSKFTEEVQKITCLYQNGQHSFPKINIPKDLDHKQYNNKLFVKKINEISHHEILTEAINDYVFANTTILDELKKYEVYADHYLKYKKQLKRKHNSKYREKCAELKLNVQHDVVICSQIFYDFLMGEDPQQLYPFTNTPPDFRNGIYHILADDEDDNIHWKLKR